MSLFCYKCGTELPEDAVYCFKCGTKAIRSYSAVKEMSSEDEDKGPTPGSTITFGSYVQNEAEPTPIEWIVLERSEGTALLIARYCLECRLFHDSSSGVNWAESDLRLWLNDYFFNNAFTEEERSQIARTHLVNDNNPQTGTPGGPQTDDYIFCLSVSESKYYFDPDYVNKYGETVNRFRAARVTDHAKANGADPCEDTSEWYGGNGLYWLRTPGARPSFACFVNYAGKIDTDGEFAFRTDLYAVRPALRVKF